METLRDAFGFKDFSRAERIGFVVFTLFLLVFPWLESWDTNYFGWIVPAWRNVWVNTYFRGAVSGLGLVNIFVSFVEIVRLRRFSTP